MLKASALYMVIIIALVIGVLCSSLIVAAYFYKSQYQRKFRFDQLENNVNSGINILLASSDTSYLNERTFSLFQRDNDSVSLKRFPWGIYDIGISKAVVQKDTLINIFSFANRIDSSKWAALYLMDEDRPFSVSGKTTILGDAYIPKAGIKTAYIDNIGYLGDKRMIIGAKHFSEKTLPALNEKRLQQLEQYYDHEHPGDSSLVKSDSTERSFLLPTHFVNLKKRLLTINNMHLSGNIVLLSDTSLVIDSTVTLNNVLIFAKSIKIKQGFHGNAQFFATDSIGIDSNCRFNYPSCLGILRFKAKKVRPQAQIVVGKNTIFNGIIFTYEKNETTFKSLIIIEKDAKINGQIYSQGVLELLDQSVVNGSVFTSRFLYKTTFTTYENYLINTTIDSKNFSPYYLTSDLFPVAKNQKKVLQWLMVK